MIAENALIGAGSVSFLTDGSGLLLLGLKEPKLSELKTQGLFEVSVGVGGLVGGLVLPLARPGQDIFAIVASISFLLLFCLTLLRSMWLWRQAELWKNMPTVQQGTERELVYMFFISLAVWLSTSATGHWRIPYLAMVGWNVILGISYVRLCCPGAIGLRLHRRLYAWIRVISVIVWVLALGITLGWLIGLLPNESTSTS